MWKYGAVAVVLAACATAWGQTVPATSNAGDTAAREATVRKKMEENIKEIAADGVGLEKVLTFISDTSGVSVGTDWEAFGKLGINRDSGVELSVKDIPLRRALTEVLDQVSAGRATFWVENGKVQIGVKDQTPPEKKKRAAVLIARARELAGQPRAAAHLLIQARVMDGAGDQSLLTQVMGQVKDGGFTEAFSADGSVVLAAEFNAHQQGQLKDTLKEITSDGQRLVKVIYFIRDNMGINASVDWSALGKAGVNRDSQVTLSVKDVTFELALQTILQRAAPGKLGMADNDGVLAISTAQELASSPRFQCVWAYDVRALQVGQAANSLVPSVRAEVDAKAWANGCYAEVSGGVLFVRQTWENQRKVAAAVEKLRGTKRP